MKFLLATLVFFQLFSLEAFAYIPRTQTIIKKMVRNNGQRQYKVVREIVIESKEKQIKAREVWTIASGDKMKVEVSSLDTKSPWNFAIYYSSNDRKTLSRKKSVKAFKKSADFFEPLFHDRSNRSLMRRMMAYKFVPDWIGEAIPPAYDEEKKQTKMTPEPFVTLTPMEGSVNYTFSAKNNSEGGNSQTTLWVEQDSFLIKKGKLRSSAEFVNSKYQSFSGGLMLPGEQIISWKDRVARVKLLTVERTKTKKKDWELSTNSTGSIPTDPLVKEFYSRFR